MYAAIHPDGLVIFSQDNLLNTQLPTTPATFTLAGNESHRANRKPQGVTVVPDDPWWIRLVETESPLTKELPEINVDWVGRVRVKVANETTKAFHTKPITKPTAFASTTPKPKSTTRATVPTPKSHDIPDENAIIYNYKSYETSVIQLNTDP